MNNRITTQAHDGQVLVGIKKDLQNVASIPIGGSTYTMVALEQLVQSRIDAVNRVLTAKAQWTEATAAFKALDPQVSKVVRGLRDYVINAFGETSPVLADFGFEPPKKGTLTPEENVARAEKAAATRKARGTLGKKQKAKIKGTVVTTAPATAPSAGVAATPTASPAAAPVAGATSVVTASK
jgi:hypothetical protein